MPEPADILRLTLIHELDGVAMRNDIYWQLQILGTAGTMTEITTILYDEWISDSQPVLTNQVTYVAAVLENLTRNEVRGLVTSTADGNSPGNAHPQDQVLRFNEYARSEDDSRMHRGAFNLSGTAVTASRDGRVITTEPYQPIENYLGQQFLDSPSGLTLNPQVRTRIPGSQPPAYLFHRTLEAIVNPTFLKLKSRKTNVLA